MTKIDKVDILFIRAAKSDNPLIMVRRVYKRFYLGTNTNWDDLYISQILVDICDNFMPMRLIDAFSSMDPHSYALKDITQSDWYYTMVVKVLISHIRSKSVAHIHGYKSPSRYGKCTHV